MDFASPSMLNVSFPAALSVPVSMVSIFAPKSCFISSCRISPAELQQSAVFADKTSTDRICRVSAVSVTSILSGVMALVSATTHPGDIVHATEHQHRARRYVADGGSGDNHRWPLAALCVIISAVGCRALFSGQRKRVSGLPSYFAFTSALAKPGCSGVRVFVVTVQTAQRRRLPATGRHGAESRLWKSVSGTRPAPQFPAQRGSRLFGRGFHTVLRRGNPGSSAMIQNGVLLLIERLRPLFPSQA